MSLLQMDGQRDNNFALFVSLHKQRLISWKRVLLEKLEVAQLARYFPLFMKRALPCLQEPTTARCP
jgi:hypothetical protein